MSTATIFNTIWYSMSIMPLKLSDSTKLSICLTCFCLVAAVDLYVVIYSSLRKVSLIVLCISVDEL